MSSTSASVSASLLALGLLSATAFAQSWEGTFTDGFGGNVSICEKGTNYYEGFYSEFGFLQGWTTVAEPLVLNGYWYEPSAEHLWGGMTLTLVQDGSTNEVSFTGLYGEEDGAINIAWDDGVASVQLETATPSDVQCFSGANVPTTGSIEGTWSPQDTPYADYSIVGCFDASMNYLASYWYTADNVEYPGIVHGSCFPVRDSSNNIINANVLCASAWVEDSTNGIELTRLVAADTYLTTWWSGSYDDFLAAPVGSSFDAKVDDSDNHQYHPITKVSGVTDTCEDNAGILANDAMPTGITLASAFVVVGTTASLLW